MIEWEIDAQEMLRSGVTSISDFSCKSLQATDQLSLWRHMCRIDRFEFNWSNAQLIKQNKTKMCRLREDWAQWMGLRLILLKSVLLFQVTYCSVTKLISPNSTMSVNDFHEYKSTPHTNQMNYIQNNKDHWDTNSSKLAVVPFQVIQIGCRSAFLFSIKLVIIFITFAIYRSK